jgi:hypothetical protein
VDFKLGGESEVDDFDGGEIVAVFEQYVFYLIMEILACFEVPVDDVQPVQVLDPLEQVLEE